MRSLETKKEIRKKIKALRASLSVSQRQEYSECIQQRLLNHPFYQNADEIFCYVSFGDEVRTSAIMKHSLENGKKLAVPKILADGSGLSMEFFYIDSMDELEKGYFGILEPSTLKKAEGLNVLTVMPGVAFDLSCSRIGYGKGFYDTYLRRHPNYRRIALAYSIQCIESIPSEIHDIRPEQIITEEGVIINV